MPAASIVASWRLKIAMSSGLTLPPAREQRDLLAGFVQHDALAAQFGAQRQFVRGEQLALDATCPLVLALPVEGDVACAERLERWWLAPVPWAPAFTNRS
jgi:hypothetical protein